MIEPYYQDNMVTIYHGDCAEIAPQLGRFDLLLTDPPYGIGESRAHAGRPHNAPVSAKNPRGTLVMQRGYDVESWDDETVSQSLIDSLVAQCEVAVVFGGNYYRMPPTPSLIVWDKNNGRNDFADCEVAWSNHGGAARLIKWTWNGMVKEVRGKHEEKRVHPTQKPLAVMDFCIQAAMGHAESVFDPFMGSGTTLVAARRNGIRSVGIDREEKYCEIAAQRVSQMSLFE